MTLDCITNNLIHARCCSSSRFSHIVNREQIGDTCTELETEKRKFTINQMFLDKLMCIQYDQLEMECLTEDEIITLLEQVLNYCKPC